MSETELVQASLEISRDVNVTIKGKNITVSGPNGTLTRDFSFARAISIEKNDKIINLFTYNPRKKQKSLLNTLKSHIENLVKGAQNNFIYKMKIVYAHFPMTITIKGDKIIIENFLGERNPRIARIYGKKTKVTQDGEDIIIESAFIEDVGQTAANIQRATKIKNKDPRVFQDGIYLYQKIHGETEFWKLKV